MPNLPTLHVHSFAIDIERTPITEKIVLNMMADSQKIFGHVISWQMDNRPLAGRTAMFFHKKYDRDFLCLRYCFNAQTVKFMDYAFYADVKTHIETEFKRLTDETH